ncbi:MAG: BRO family protein [Burkholderia gladioli]
MTHAQSALALSGSLAFRNTTFDVVDRNGQPWLRVQQIAVALGYKRPDVLQQVYASHSSEFTDSMTALADLPTAGGVQQVRIFSLRGAHLLGMFARTPIAAEFRKWVLDILDREIGQRAIPDLSAEAMLRLLRAGRWLMTVQGNNIVLNPAPLEAYVLSAEEFAGMIRDPSGIPRKLLPKIIEAAASRLDQS